MAAAAAVRAYCFYVPLDFDLEGQDRFACIGIRMIRVVVGHMEYQNAVGLNNLVFTLPA